MFRLATNDDVPHLQRLLTKAWKVTYAELYPEEYINRVISEFYNYDRLLHETSTNSKEWSGYYVIEVDKEIIGCIGGGVVDDQTGEIYVLYIDPDQKRKGYGSELVHEFTRKQIENYNIKIQNVAVTEGNEMGIPFYEKIGFKAKTIKELYFNDGSVQSKSIVMQRAVS